MLKSISRGSAKAPTLASVLVAWGCTLLVCAAPASAAPGDDATIVASPFSAASGTVTSKPVSCPAGQRVVGGGSGPGGTVDPSYLSLLASSPFDETGTAGGTNDGEVARIWSASVRNVNPTPTTSYSERVFANCSANSDAVIDASTGTLPGIGPGNTGSVTTTCPAGMRAIGGGFSSFGSDADFTLRASGPVDETGLTENTFSGDVARGWSVLVTNFSVASRSFGVFALCSKDSDATVVVDSFIVSPSTETTKTMNCPAGKRALGGGIGTTSAVGPYLTSSAPVAAVGTTAGTNTGDVARGWLASVFDSGSTGARYLTFALCASDPGTGPAPGPGPDTTSPETKITKHPKKNTKKRRASFSFSSTESGGSFECKLDKGAFTRCTSPFAKKVKPGRKHHFSVVAIDATGNRDLTPATYSWKVKKKSRRKH